MGIDVSGIEANAGQIIISGGEIYAYSTSNDAIDANGTITVTGGLAVAVGAGTPEGGFDCDNNTFAIKGGTLIGIGGSHSTPTESVCTQPVVIVGNQNLTGGQDLVLKGDKQILSYKAVRTFSGATLLISSPSFSKGVSYTFGNSTISCASDKWVNGSSDGGQGGPGGPGGAPGQGGGFGPGRP